MKPYSEWLPADVARMTELWTAGRSAAVIAAEIGKSRSAVLGKIDRLGLARGTQGANPVDKPFRPKSAPRAPFMPRPILPPDNPVSDSPEPEPPREFIGPLLRKTLIALKPDDCHFPIGDPRDPAFAFCALPVAPGRPYCAAHCAASYTPRVPPTRKNR